MARSNGKARQAGIAFALGMAASLFVAVANKAGLDRRLEWPLLDARFRYTPHHTDLGNFVHVDIDDRSLREVGRWPWPRQRLAELVNTLDACGARMVALDIILAKPQDVRFEHEAMDPYAAGDAPILQQAPPRPVFDDLLLADALAASGRVVLPFYRHADRMLIQPSEQQRSFQAMSMLSERPDQSLAEMARRWTTPAGEDEAGAADGLPEAYLWARSVLALQSHAVNVQPDISRVGTGETTVAPLAPFAERIDGAGFVEFQPDADGVTRRIRPIQAAVTRGCQLQFALAIAREMLAEERGDLEAVEVDDGRLGLMFAKRPLQIPLSRDGDVLVNWQPRTLGRDGHYPESLHISSAAALRAARHGWAIARNRRLLRITQLDIARRLRQEAMLELFARADELDAAIRAARRDRYHAMLYDPANVPDPPTTLREAEEGVEEQLDRLAATLRKELDSFYLATVPKDPVGKKAYDELSALRDRWDRIKNRNQQLEGQIQPILQEITQRVEGRLCLVGSTATGAADFVATPLNERTPGVVVHGNLLASVVSGRFIRPAAGWLTSLTILLAGALVALLTALLPVVPAACVMILLACGYLGFNAGVLFSRWGFWLTAAGPILSMLGAFVVVTAYRQLTEERAKRRIRGMFAHALSPQLVQELLADPSLAELGGQDRPVTCLFSDLGGFTSLSGRLGPEDTVRVLNRYFDCVTEVVQHRHGGYINKFLGDGIFALFGAPVWQEDHPCRSVEAAEEYCREVDRLNESLGDLFDFEVRLHVRIGVHTDEAMVGNCGSSERMDYTAIGEVVNLASRLEAANKYFGTQVLLSGETWKRCRQEDFIARSLGVLRIDGVARSVEVWNVLGRTGKVSEQTSRFAEIFNQGMQHLRGWEFTEAVQCFLQAIEAVPADRPARLYLEIARMCSDRQPVDTWPGPDVGVHGVQRIELPRPEGGADVWAILGKGKG